MRHRVKGTKLSRTASHRRATMRALTIGLITSKTKDGSYTNRIVTTVAKAKALRGFIEPLITRAKEGTHQNRKEVFSSLQHNDAVTRLFDEVGPKAKDRPGGYTRVIKIGFRQGDGAEMAVIELVDYNDIQPEGKSSKKKKTRRAGKANASVSTELEAANTTEEVEATKSAEPESGSAEETEEEK